MTVPRDVTLCRIQTFASTSMQPASVDGSIVGGQDAKLTVHLPGTILWCKHSAQAASLQLPKQLSIRGAPVAAGLNLDSYLAPSVKD